MDDDELKDLEDPAVWSDESFPLPPAADSGTRIVVRLASGELGQLEQAAIARGMRVAEFIRMASLERAADGSAERDASLVRRPA
jgi:predicted DNA binding CopG/RHH family protein